MHKRIPRPRRRAQFVAVGIAAVVALMATSAFGSSSHRAASGPIVVGSVLDLTGPLNIYGKPKYDATKLAIQDINANGGVLGRKLKLVFYDAQSQIAKYTLYTNKLALQDHPVVVEGSITSASREAMRPVLARYKIPFFHNEQWEGGVCQKNVFGTGTTPNEQLIPLLKYAIKKYGPKIYVAAADYGYGQISAKWVQKLAPQFGGKVVKTVFVPLDNSDFGSIIDDLQKTQPNIMFSLLVGANHTAFFRSFASAGLGAKMHIVSPTFGIGNEHILLPPSETKGITTGYAYYQELNTPENKALVALWHKTYGKNYPYINDSAVADWNGWHLWAEAVKMAGTTDSAAVIKALESGKVTYNSPSGPITMDGPSHAPIQNVSLAMTSGHGFKVFATYKNQKPTFEMQVCNLIKNPTINKQFTP
jgi:urea transport system substrate-binding protein